MGTTLDESRDGVLASISFFLPMCWCRIPYEPSLVAFYSHVRGAPFFIVLNEDKEGFCFLKMKAFRPYFLRSRDESLMSRSSSVPFSLSSRYLLAAFTHFLLVSCAVFSAVNFRSSSNNFPRLGFYSCDGGLFGSSQSLVGFFSRSFQLPSLAIW